MKGSSDTYSIKTVGYPPLYNMFKEQIKQAETPLSENIKVALKLWVFFSYRFTKCTISASAVSV